MIYDNARPRYLPHMAHPEVLLMGLSPLRETPWIETDTDIGRYHRHKLALKVEIEDNGPGVAPELQERIFLPMVTDAEGGTGLGLTIAQNIINRHRGLIECRSKKGETVFSIFLPLENADD